VVRRHVFEAVCGFDESLFLYCEDVDLSWKLAAHGRIEHCDEALFLHDTNRRGPRADTRCPGAVTSSERAVLEAEVAHLRMRGSLPAKNSRRIVAVYREAVRGR